MEQFERISLLLGDDSLQKLNNKKVLIVPFLHFS